MYIINAIRGFCMALADSVPGVSGGTIAFILGFYDEFINSLNSLVSIKKGPDERKKKLDAIKFLLKLGVGWVIGMVSSILFLTSIFEEHIYEISSLFTGFIVLSIPIILRDEKKVIVNKYKNIIFVIIGILVVSAMTYFNPVSSGESGIDLAFSNLNIGLALYVFVAGMIAIAAMVLPGISGSTLLLIFGLYAPVLNAVKSVITLDFSYLPIVIIFALGVITGIISTIRLLRYLLNNYRSQMVYLILGLMIGSLYPVFMGPTTLKIPLPAMNIESFNFLFFALGGLLIFGLEKLRVFFEGKSR